MLVRAPAAAGARWWLPGRHELKSGLFDRSWSGSYARAGYLKTLVRRRARSLETGAAQPVAGLPIALSRARGWRRDGLRDARARPGSRRCTVVAAGAARAEVRLVRPILVRLICEG